MYAIEPVYRNDELEFIAGSTCDDNRFCSIAKLTPGSYGYTSIVCARLDANLRGIVGANLPPVKLVGTRWEGVDRTFCIVSLPSVFIMSMQETIVTGSINDPDVVESWSRISQDHAEYLNHIDTARRERSDIDKVFVLLDGEEATYVSTNYDARHWDALAPSVTIQTCTPEDIPDVFAAVRGTLGCDRNMVPPTAATATVAPPPGLPPTITIVREVDLAADTELTDMRAVFTTFLMAGDINYADGVITNLRPPVYSDPFNDVLSSKKTEARNRGLKMALHSVLNQDEDNDYESAGKLDAKKAYLSLHCIPDPLVKLVVNGKFSTTLVADVSEQSPTVDIYSFMPQLENNAEVAKALRQGDYEQNEDIMGQVDIHLMKKKLSTKKLGKIVTYDDAIRTVINLAVLNLAMENLTGSAGSQSICYQLLMQFAALFLRPSWKKWAEQKKDEMPQLPFYLVRVVEIFYTQLAKLTVSYHIVSKVKANQIEAIPHKSYTNLLKIFLNLEEKITRLIGEDSPLLEVPKTCPDACNPTKIRAAAAVRGALVTIRAEGGHNARGNGGHAYNGRGNVGNQFADDMSRGAGRGDGRGRGAGRGDGGGGRGDGGRGAGRGNGRGGGTGRGGGRGGFDDMTREERSRGTGSFHARPNVTNFFPPGLSGEYCSDWMFVGKFCSKPFGQCSGHFKFDTIRHAGDKQRIEQHIRDAQNMWFNNRCVKSLTDAASKLKLGDANGPTGE